jgi:hypothetical protein
MQWTRVNDTVDPRPRCSGPASTMQRTRATDAAATTGHIPTVDQLVEVSDHQIVDLLQDFTARRNDVLEKWPLQP